MGFAMSDYSELNCCNKQKLVEDLKTVVADAEEILRATAGVAGEKMADLRVTIHTCRGNFKSAWVAQGGYAPVVEAMFSTDVDGYFMEFDSERAGDFEPLHVLQDSGDQDKKVVLGLDTTKRAELEDKHAVIARIHEAAKYVPLENLCLSPQCGFASCEIGNKLTEEQQWAKVALVREIAEEVWGD